MKLYTRTVQFQEWSYAFANVIFIKRECFNAKKDRKQGNCTSEQSNSKSEVMRFAAIKRECFNAKEDSKQGNCTQGQSKSKNKIMHFAECSIHKKRML